MRQGNSQSQGRVILCPFCRRKVGLKVFDIIDHDDGTFTVPDYAIRCPLCQVEFTIERNKVTFQGQPQR